MTDENELSRDEAVDDCVTGSGVRALRQLLYVGVVGVGTEREVRSEMAVS